MRAAGLASLGLWLTAGAWSASYGTDGHIPFDLVRPLGGNEKHAQGLVSARLWKTFGMDYQFVPSDLWSISESFTRAPISAELRQTVYERDHFRCVKCGSEDDLTLDHIHPWSLGGPDTLANLQAMCRPCNSAKGARV